MPSQETHSRNYTSHETSGPINLKFGHIKRTIAKMLSRKPTAIKLTQEDIQDYDNLVAAQQQPSPQSKDTSNPSRKPQKGKEVVSTAQDRQQSMDERIGVTTGTIGTRGTRR
jgi:hypothetical protein